MNKCFTYVFASPPLIETTIMKTGRASGMKGVVYYRHLSHFSFYGLAIVVFELL